MMYSIGGKTSQITGDVTMKNSQLYNKSMDIAISTVLPHRAERFIWPWLELRAAATFIGYFRYTQYY